MRAAPWQAALVALVVAAAVVACNERRDAIRVEEGTLIVENQSSQEWRNVVITVNDHFRGGTATLAARGRMTAPLGQFKTAFGQPYDRSRQSVYKVEVTATDRDGRPVKMTWNGNRLPR